MARPARVARALERGVLLSALALGALMFFQRTRLLGRLLLAVWLVGAWPLAWLWRAIGPGAPPADPAGSPSS